ncbi:hypothetical protein E2C01_037954 [Portunus trituberculatus]|uniref:Uncharacterized protein n=1 Tax=Portunus trituberculatus TaxID=210409 RepID=A0A5B7FGN2_PORTR|nr:hypothetical protein [Portunus trituberculatus]
MAERAPFDRSVAATSRQEEWADTLREMLRSCAPPTHNQTDLRMTLPVSDLRGENEEQGRRAVLEIPPPPIPVLVASLSADEKNSLCAALG